MNRAKRRRFSSKLRAKYALRGNLLPCMATALVVFGLRDVAAYFAARTLPDYNTVLNTPDIFSLLPAFAVFALIMLIAELALSPLKLGLYWWLSELTMLRKPRFSELFGWITSLRRLMGALGARLMFILIGAADYMLLAGIPAAGIYLAYRNVDKLGYANASSLILLAGLLAIAGLVTATVDLLSYKPALYLYAASPELGIRASFAQCRRFMAHRRMEFAVLHLSMLGWLIGEYLSFGLLSLYTRPYFDLTFISYTQYAYKLWLVDSGKLSRERFELPLPGVPNFNSGWLW